MAFAVICRRWEQAAPIEIYVEIQASSRWLQLRREFFFVRSIERFIKDAEILLHFVIQRIQFSFLGRTVDIVCGLRGGSRDTGGLVTFARIAEVVEPDLRLAQKGLCVHGRGLVRARLDLFSQRFKTFSEI